MAAISSVSGSGTMSSAGVGSGLDVEGIVSKLMAIERQPITKIDTKTTTIEAELTAYGTLKGALSTLQGTVQTLASSSTFSATKATVADTTLFSATTGTSAAPGTYSVTVDRLAKAQKLQSSAFGSSTDSLGTGSLTFDFGTYATSGGLTSFTPSTTKKSATVTISSGADSLTSVASAINAAKIGVSATVINDGTSNYLVFSPTDGGSANSLRVSVSDNDGGNLDAAGLSRLAFDKSTGYSLGSYDFSTGVAISAAAGNNQFQIAVNGGTATTITLDDATYNNTNIVAAVQAKIDAAFGSPPAASNATVALDASNRLRIASAATSGQSSIEVSAVSGNLGLVALFGTETTSLSAAKQQTETVAPVDALIHVDGIAITKSSNTITDAIQGVTLSLLKESATATTLAVASDTSGVGTAVTSFTKAYNDAAKMLADLLAYDPKTRKSGALQREGTVRLIQAQLRASVQSIFSGNAGGLSSLSDVGISFQRDGTLAFDSSKLTTALSDPTKDVGALFIGKSGATGIATSVYSALTAMVGSSGSIASRTSGMNTLLSTYATQKSTLELRMTIIENRYRKQFSNLDTAVASMKQTSTYLEQQLANLPSISNSSSN